MSINTEEYVKRAEQCERLAGACIADRTAKSCSTQRRTGGCWAEFEAEAGAVPTLPRKAMQGSGGLDDAEPRPGRAC